MNTIKLNTIGTPKASGGNSGGGGSASGEGDWEYYDFNGIANTLGAPKDSLIAFVEILGTSISLVKTTNFISPNTADLGVDTSSLEAFGLLYGVRSYVDKENDITFTREKWDSLVGQGVYDSVFAPNKITKEEFYTL